MKSQNFWKDALWVNIFAGYVWTIGQTGEKTSAFKTKTDTSGQDLQVMLHETIRNDDF